MCKKPAIGGKFTYLSPITKCETHGTIESFGGMDGEQFIFSTRGCRYLLSELIYYESLIDIRKKKIKDILDQ